MPYDLEPSGGKERKRSGNGTVELAVRHKPGLAFVEPSFPTAIEGREAVMIDWFNHK